MNYQSIEYILPPLASDLSHTIEVLWKAGIRPFYLEKEKVGTW